MLLSRKEITEGKGEKTVAKLVKFIRRTAIVHAESGIKINSINTEIGPGGLDSEVVKNPLTGRPYIPGSSFKGKMRHMLERKYGAKNPSGLPNVMTKKRGSGQDTRVEEVYMPCGCGKRGCMICTMFGAHMNMQAECGPSRLKVRDLNLTEEFKKLDNERLLESRVSTMVDRKTGTAANSTLRQTERTSSGLDFKMELVIEVYDTDDENKFTEILDEGLRMLELSGIGGETSRGYGHISIKNIKDEVIMD